jgi:hypothetical protein
MGERLHAQPRHDLVGHIDGYWIVAVWYFGLGIGGVANKLTLGDGGC